MNSVVFVILSLVLGVAALLAVAYPILAKTRTAQAPAVSAQEKLDELLAQRDAAYQALRELSFDHRLGKITGEEEAFSHTDLYDLQANVEGAKVAFESVRALAEKKDAATVKDIDSRFDSLQKKLDGYRKGDGFESYTTLDEKARKEMSDAVNALRRPLAKLTEVVVEAWLDRAPPKLAAAYLEQHPTRQQIDD